MTTVSGSPAPESVAEQVPLRRWFGVAAVAMGTLVTSEQLPVGLLTSISGALEGTAALMVTVPGLVASATAPLLPVAIAMIRWQVPTR